MARYLTVWLTFAKINLIQNISERYATIFFISGKLLRFSLMYLFISNIATRIGNLNGYTLQQLITVYLIFNLFDILGQFFFRGIYSFRNSVLYGRFDQDLTLPISPLFSALMTNIDFLDFPLLSIVIVSLFFNLKNYPITNISLFLLFAINSFLIISAIHILVAALTIIFNSSENLIGIYRDVSTMARFPIDIYSFPVQLILNTVLPVGIAFTIPAKLLFGSHTFGLIVYSFIIGSVFFFASLWLWKYSLRQYTSASS